MSKILKQDLGIKCVVARFIPWLLLPEQKEHRAAVANDFIETAIDEPDFLKKVITGDESQVYGYDPERKSQLFPWKLLDSPCLEKVQQHYSKIEIMLTVFFDWEGVVHLEYASPGHIIKLIRTDT